MQFGTLKWEFRNVINMLFLSAEVSYNHMRPRILYGQSFDGILSQIITTRTKSYGESISARGIISKSFSWKNLNMGLEFSWRQGESPVLVQDDIVRYRSNSYSIEGKISVDPFKFLGLDYMVRYGENRNRQINGDKLPAVRTMVNDVSLTGTLPAGFGVYTNVHHYYNNQSVGNKSFAIADLGVYYTRKQTRFSLVWGNIFDTKNYKYSYLSSNTSFYSEYKIRPMSVMFSVRFKIL